jgi:hypothetical protein
VLVKHNSQAKVLVHLTSGKVRFQTSEPYAARTSPYTVRTDEAPKVRFSATLGEEPELEVALV